MKVESITYPVALENKNSYGITIATVDWICEQVGMRYLPSGAPDIIVKELDEKLEETVWISEILSVVGDLRMKNMHCLLPTNYKICV